MNAGVLKNGYEEFVVLLFSEKTAFTDKVTYHNKLVYTRVELASLTGASKKNVAIYLDKAILLVDRRIEFVEKQILAELSAPQCLCKTVCSSEMPDAFKPQWTADVVNLVEMAMSLHESKAINNGEVPITAVVNFFFKLFDMKPGNFFSTYGVMRTRANSRTLFLDELKRMLESKMDRDDEKEAKSKRRQ